MAKPPKDDETVDQAKLDGLLKKMLSTPPTPHKPKPAAKPKKAKPAK